ncbi:acyl-CoA dehydrogenase, middle domain protein [Dictyocaulus viviparus]|uniref:Acyl-CoA dehydrogenase, middle domain protein n=1 Tax=Dictyocaulus viviparus TaxID=29172 RepID=A0A0D8XM65_DICVI|nr:acyl-CoA dehydrogenase, middle domain protein [Dictyocaulus viviparus]
MAVCVQTNMATPALAEFGSDSLRAEFLTPSITGDLVACIAVSEPEAGSDVAGNRFFLIVNYHTFICILLSAIRTKAIRSGSDYVINGHKMWITNGYQADWACVLVNSNSNPSPHRNKSLFCADWACVLVNSNSNPSPHRNKSLFCVRLDEPGKLCSSSINFAIS